MTKHTEFRVWRASSSNGRALASHARGTEIDTQVVQIPAGDARDSGQGVPYYFLVDVANQQPMSRRLSRGSYKILITTSAPRALVSPNADRQNSLLRLPGIEPGSPRWQRGILPLDHKRCREAISRSAAGQSPRMAFA